MRKDGKHRDWREIARELARETDREKAAIVAEELNAALAESPPPKAEELLRSFTQEGGFHSKSGRREASEP